MARQTRKFGRTGIYHVMLRGINKQLMFHNDEDMHKIISILNECIKKSKVRLHAYCIMPNHVHLLLQAGGDELPESETLPEAMKRIGVCYAQYYNYTYKRIGTFFQERYRSEPVDTDGYYLTVLRYIHRNPVKAGMVESVDMYKWSSYHAYIDNPGFVYVKLGLSMLKNQFVSYMNIENIASCIDIDDTQKISDAQLAAKIEELLHIPASIISLLPEIEKKSAIRKITDIQGVSHLQISRVTNVSAKYISNAVHYK